MRNRSTTHSPAHTPARWLVPRSSLVRRRVSRGLTALALTGSLALTGCSLVDEAFGESRSSSSAQRDVGAGTGVWDAAKLHEIAVSFDDDDYAAMLKTYRTSQEKEWIKADVTIDGTTYSDAGLRLKGNSSLRSVSTDADAEDLPWLIRLDKYVDGQDLDGWTEFVVRSNSSESALNEAVALDLLREAGLASEHAVHTSFRVNGSEPTLRLVVQHLDEAWEEENFSSTGWLYKSEAEGDWSYRGDDPEKYVDVFDQETGEDDLEPLTEFLDFINNSSDDDFAEKLPDELDVTAFAKYLAFQDLVDNFDDIDGPGNNSYLRWDDEEDRFTVVAWDHNLAFGGRPGGPGGGVGAAPGQDQGEKDQGEKEKADRADGGDQAERGDRGDRGDGPPAPPEGFEPPEGMAPPEGMEPPQGMEPPSGDGTRERPDGQGRAAGPGGGNVLVERFSEVDDFQELVDEAKADLTDELYDSGRAAELLDARVEVLTEQAADLVDTSTVTSEADSIRAYFTGEKSSGQERPDTPDTEPRQGTREPEPSQAASSHEARTT